VFEILERTLERTAVSLVIDQERLTHILDIAKMGKDFASFLHQAIPPG
jgi:hypothetical protein